ncbi:hypothetical protein Desaci_1387 [Desulfosporosinus acidiphilus SJ4]|uniref:Uncharacterized protein n=1 Tax=Desulfosporosinus acidiphilus (strain DSM 22704 / JCM 16185 / SJ4) TaxID=646529 RepID=I4D3N6_DESAJ|nr:hypothetical protein [Desulfosporosinus acidiphilus]AFM40410.1 hypothetical protein Desaci_1387 [Desulfosporosinus acidiphilus SJ4]
MKNLKCPSCGKARTAAELDAENARYYGDGCKPISEDYGKRFWLYRCPICGYAATGKDLKEYNKK